MALHGKTALVTGAGSGIGRHIAQRYAREGARVGLADIDTAAVERAAAEIRKEGGEALAITMDVADEAAVTRGVGELADACGTIDILVANAGIQIVNPIESFAFADWKRLLAIHLDGAFLTTRAVLPHMYADDRGGTVIYMGSVHSHEASPLKSAYVAAKHGILGLARVLAKEGGKHNVRSHVICPGFVRTPLVERQIPEQAAELGLSEEEVIKRIMLGNTVDGTFTTLDDVAEVAHFLAAFPSSALTGQSIAVSHGWHML